MNLRPAIRTFFAFSAICVLPSAAVAACGPYFAWGGFAPWTYGPRSVYVDEHVPYYAMHPPVYYSYPVPRTYGHLPYPYVTAPVARNVAWREPRVVVNPYAVESGAAAAPPEATMPPRVHVTYPAAIFDESK